MLDIRTFFHAANPSRTLNIADPVDQKLYIDFTAVRGESIIAELRDNISFFSPAQPSYHLFTGHVGCGKSTELMRLKQDLETEAFHVVYFESTEDLELADVDIADILLAIARRVSQSLAPLQLDLGEQKGLRALLSGALQVLTADVESLKVKVPGLEGVGFDYATEGTVSLSAGIGAVTARVKNDPSLRDRLNAFMAPQKYKLVEMINAELIQPAVTQLKAKGYAGLVVIVDNLDRVDKRTKSFGRPQQEYLFIDQSDCLTKIQCHMVYTMPLALKFSSEYNLLTTRYVDAPRVLPMVPVRLPDGSICDRGLELLREMVLARALPDASAAERYAALADLFDAAETLDRLCLVSGGHVRDLLQLLSGWIRKFREFPLTRDKLETVLQARRNDITLQLSPDEWELLRQVQRTKRVGGDDNYQKLIHSRLVFEYHYQGAVWFDVNPLLQEAEALQR